MDEFSEKTSQTSEATRSEAARLEALWGGEFGDAYTQRNAAAGQGREAFWHQIVEKCRPTRVLEVGCNVGANLKPLQTLIPPHRLYGVDINLGALETARKGALSGTNLLHATGKALPFRDGFFDLVFTQGVLIHQPEATLGRVMGEIVRCSRRYVLCGEYFDENTVEVPYRGESGALFRRPYGPIYQSLFPELSLVEQGFLDRASGWDDVTWWLFEKKDE